MRGKTMNKTRITSLIIALLIMLSVFTACGEDNKPEETRPAAEPTEKSASADEVSVKKAKDIFEEVIADNGFDGAVYMVYKGREIYSGGSGKANKKEGTDNGADVVYHVASITKQFTAAAILKLCEQKKMSLDDTLSKYFPEYTAGADITIHYLLSMQSGIPDYTRRYEDSGEEASEFSEIVIDGVSEDNSAEENRRAIKKDIFSKKLLFDQGEHFSYSNANYFLLGEIIEQVSGTSYFDYIKSNFFEPLDMTTAGFMEDYDNPSATVAKGYRGINAAAIFSYAGVAFGCGDIMASPKDMYKWSVALHSGKVLGDEMYREMIKKQAVGDAGYSSYGYGLMINDGFYFHSGSLPCFLSMVMYSPQFDTYLALMSNYASETVNTCATDALKRIMQETDLFQH